jgi:hypothetical protein
VREGDDRCGIMRSSTIWPAAASLTAKKGDDPKEANADNNRCWVRVVVGKQLQ